MSRLTKKIKDNIYIVGDNLIEGYSLYGQPINKLGQIEDLLEKYGVNDIEYLELILAQNVPHLYTQIKDVDCGDYLIDKKGNVFSKQTKIILKQHLNKQGYAYVMIQGKQKLIHRLVAKTFIPNPNNYFEVNHKNEIKNDNNVENLEWCSRKYNATYNNCHLRHSEWEKKPIDQYDLNGNLIKTWSYALEVEKAGVGKSTNIKQCCRNQLCTHNGYIWRWHNDTFETRRIKKEYERARNFKIKRDQEY